MSNPKTRSNYVVPFCIRRVKDGPDRCVVSGCDTCINFSNYMTEAIPSTIRVKLNRSIGMLREVKQ